MNNLQIFKSNDFGEIRTATVDNEPMFCLTDVCKALSLKQPSKVKERLSEKGVHTIPTLTKGGKQNLLYINESNLYKTIFQSRKDTAEKFTDWITSEVIPSIRKTGGYIAGQESMSDIELLSMAVLVAQKQINERNQKIQEMTPKALFADAVSASETSILIGDLAKLICQNGVKIGQKRLFQWMRENGYLIKQKGNSWNMPTQRSIEQGLFEVKETTITHSDGHITVNKTVKVTGKAQVFFVNKFLAGKKQEGNSDETAV